MAFSFGAGQNTQGGFGAKPAATGLFGNTTAAPTQGATSTNTFSFGSQSQPRAQPGAQPAPQGNSLFGQKPGGTFGSQPAQQGSTGLFGSQPAPQSSTGLFGSQPAQQSSTGLFGSQPAQQGSTGLFGSQPAQQSSTGLFGSQPAQQSSTGLFGSQPTQQGLSGLFGSQPAQQGSTGLFGTQPAQQSQTGLFGSTQPNNALGKPGALGASVPHNPLAASAPAPGSMPAPDARLGAPLNMQLERIRTSWDTSNLSTCQFQVYLYNRAPDAQSLQQLCVRRADAVGLMHDNLWNKALQENPEPERCAYADETLSCTCCGFRRAPGARQHAAH